MMKSNKPLNHVSCSIEEHSFLESLKEPRNNVYAGFSSYWKNKCTCGHVQDCHDETGLCHAPKDQGGEPHSCGCKHFIFLERGKVC